MESSTKFFLKFLQFGKIIASSLRRKVAGFQSPLAFDRLKCVPDVTHQRITGTFRRKLRENDLDNILNKVHFEISGFLENNCYLIGLESGGISAVVVVESAHVCSKRHTRENNFITRVLMGSKPSS